MLRLTDSRRNERGKRIASTGLHLQPGLSRRTRAARRERAHGRGPVDGGVRQVLESAGPAGPRREEDMHAKKHAQVVRSCQPTSLEPGEQDRVRPRPARVSSVPAGRASTAAALAAMTSQRRWRRPRRTSCSRTSGLLVLEQGRWWRPVVQGARRRPARAGHPAALQAVVHCDASTSRSGPGSEQLRLTFRDRAQGVGPPRRRCWTCSRPEARRLGPLRPRAPPPCQHAHVARERG